MPPMPQPAPQPVAARTDQTLMGALAYLSLLIIIPYLTSKNDPFVKFHIKQGLILVIIEVAAMVLGSFLWQLWGIFQLVNLATLILAIIGIVNVINKKQVELPFVGSLAKNFHF